MKQYLLTLSFLLMYTFVAQTTNAQTSEADSTKQQLIQLPFGELTEDRLVGSVDVITGEQLMHAGYPTISTALTGLVPGYSQGRVRGKARGGSNDGPVIIIDGLSNRFLSSITIDEVESISILKDVTAKMLYGSRAANGVILIKTKRGIDADPEFSVSAEYGLRTANEYPEFVGAADEMKYRNQAYQNDGKDPLYTDDDIALAGSSYKYPDIDYYDMFVNQQTDYQKINTQLIGGDERTQYFFNMGYMGENGLEKVGDRRRNDIFNVRSNLDYEVNDIISVNLDIAGRFALESGNHVNNSSLFSQLSTRKPNDYPMFISNTANVDSMGTSDVVGGSNLYGDMVYSGYRKSKTAIAQTNLGMDLDLNKFVEGLTGRIYTTFDVNNYIIEGKNYTYRTLKPATVAGSDPVRDTLLVNGVNNLVGNEKKIADSYYRNMGGGAQIDYVNTFGDHSISATLSSLVEQKTYKTTITDEASIQGDRASNFGLRANYAFQNKYIVEYTGSYMGSTRFHEDNRWKLFSAFGASYIVSKEDFMQDVDFIDYLKVKASYGTIGYDQSFDYLLYNDYYKYWAGSFKHGEQNAKTLVGTEYLQAGNKGLTFEESTEFNVGVSARMLNNTLAFSAEYYTENRTGMPTTMQYAIPKLAGLPSIVDNYNAIETKGFELSAQYTNNIEDFVYSVGGHITKYSSTYSKYDELNDFDFQNREGTQVGDIWGYVADGFYQDAADIASYGAEDGVPLSSSLGTVIPGDLKFKDLSDNYDEYNFGDNVINKYDKTVIGNSTPDYVFSININLKYKNFSFYALGQAVGPFDRMYTSPSYYTNKGNVKYSKFVTDAAVPTFDVDGTAVGLESNDFSRPRLTTESAAHSYNGSTFFLKEVSYFKLRNVELNYQLPERVASAIAATQANIFVRGSDLLTISSEKDLDPESPYAGLTSTPRFMTVTGGFKLVF